MRKTPLWPFVLVTAFIVLAEWRAHVLSLWNCLPIALGYGHHVVTKSRCGRLAAFAGRPAAIQSA